MSLQNPKLHEHTLYHADSNMTHHLKSIRDRIHHICGQHVNQFVRVETLDGDVFEGVIVQCNRGILYLRLPGDGGMRGFTSNAYNDVILPLVLFELLVITLLYT
ncbi:hypothetical protein SAMN03159341_11379 [Paenibacillus sp. 1_12]|uniref:hypothetical protein n=1 Tax=Paenibacillus sp. 1_12 TaxID=1566278 RepID=UPI0008F21982|nr:hypothetical protein [Paenibacillus sp. 1_12]SFL98481.1 hypothetical protein SAMN03159341_11379 [Paenibacillus sp. 1_12]